MYNIIFGIKLHIHGERENCIKNHEIGKSLHFKSRSSTTNTLNIETCFNSILNIETNLLVPHIKIVTGYCSSAGKTGDVAVYFFKKYILIILINKSK